MHHGCMATARSRIGTHASAPTDSLPAPIWAVSEFQAGHHSSVAEAVLFLFRVGKNAVPEEIVLAGREVEQVCK